MAYSTELFSQATCLATMSSLAKMLSFLQQLRSNTPDQKRYMQIINIALIKSTLAHHEKKTGLLIKNQANPFCTIYGNSVIRICLTLSNYKILKQSLKSNHHPCNQADQNPLHLAVLAKSARGISVIIEETQDKFLHMVDKHGKSALDYAQESQQHQLIKQLSAAIQAHSRSSPQRLFTQQPSNPKP